MGDKWEYNQFFADPTLMCVVTISEASVMWDKTRKSIQVRIDKGDLAARKSTTGGSILISAASLRRLWGEPLHDDLNELYIDESG